MEKHEGKIGLYLVGLKVISVKKAYSSENLFEVTAETVKGATKAKLDFEVTGEEVGSYPINSILNVSLEIN